MDNAAPYILEETGDFAVVFKPPGMHCLPLGEKKGDTLFEWYAAHNPKAFDLVHRLDYETHGLALFANNKKSYDFFKVLQAGGEFIKEYSAVCSRAVSSRAVFTSSGFPPPPALALGEASPEKPLIIESFFRPFALGRKQVRPVINDGKKHKEVAKDRGTYYRTEIIDIAKLRLASISSAAHAANNGAINGNVFTVRIRRGFRHQIRCHLCWIGFPILNDPLYNYPAEDGTLAFQDTLALRRILALRARALFFTDPSSGRRLEYNIAPLVE
ncbi:MAG: hypothetical protein LBH44_05710 [Treponema sp.]|nr:hypothetical protein [Treponema sp.]